MKSFSSLKDLETFIAPAYMAYSEFAPTHTGKKYPVCKEVENSISYSESPLFDPVLSYFISVPMSTPHFLQIHLNTTHLPTRRVCGKMPFVEVCVPKFCSHFLYLQCILRPHNFYLVTKRV